jgi:predicted ATPase/class 3 adenylate cyclase
MTRARHDLPSGTVTFLFTDIEGSTKLLHKLGAEPYAEALAEHRHILREAFDRHGGVEVDTQGDAFFYAFPTAPGALEAVREGQDALASGPIHVRVGIHTGTPHLTDEGYVGEDVHKGARIGAAGHGGQVLISQETRALIDVEVTDLGEHRLKDFDAPVSIFQLGKERFPPLKTISNTNLPRPASSFVGRESELAEILSLMRGGARLLTLTGPGGSGKTRLAIEAATAVVPDYRNGVFWVGLSPLRDGALVVDAIAQTLGAKDELAAFIGEREMLLLLDNFEQVVDAAPELSSLLAGCPNLRLLVTSRELLRVQGEVEYAVSPLADREAVELFCARSRMEPTESIAGLCRRLDNLPLAVELAAARTSVLTPAEILERLSKRLDLFRGGRDADPRQMTLRATIEWSYELLTRREQTLFACVSVFAGGWSLASAEEVAQADLDTMQSLVDKSLLRRGDGRFWMLETIREFAIERLESSGEVEELRRRHAEYFLALAEEAEQSILGMAPAEWLDRLERDHDNLRAALDWLETSGDIQRALRLGGAVWEFWCLRNHGPEGWRRLEHLIELDDRPTPARAKALTGSTHLAFLAGADHESYGRRAEEAVALHRELGDAGGVAYAEFQYAGGLSAIGDFAKARPLFEQSVRQLREVGDEHRELQAMRMLAWACQELGDAERFRTLHEEILSRARTLGDLEPQWWSLSSLGSVAAHEGRHRDALALLEEAYNIAREFGDPGLVDMNLIRLGEALALADKPELAARLLALADTMHEELGWAYEGWLVTVRDAAEARVRAQLDEAAFAEAWEQGRKLTADDAVALVMSLDRPESE